MGKEMEMMPVDVVLGDDKVFATDPLKNSLYRIDKSHYKIEKFNYSSTESNLYDSIYYDYSEVGGGLLYEDLDGLIYVTNPKDKTIEIFDNNNSRFIDKIELDKQSCPIDLAIDTLDRILFVADTGNGCSLHDKNNNGSLIVTDLESREVIDQIPLEKVPNDIAVDNETHKIFVTNQFSDSMASIDPFSFETTFISEIGLNSYGVTANSKEGFVYLTSAESNSIIMYDTKTDKIEHKVTMDIEPVGAGTLNCEGNNIFLNKTNIVSDESICQIESINGFKFASMVNGKGENIQTLNYDPDSNLIDRIVQEIVHLVGYDKKFLPIKTSGNYTVTFVESNALIPTEQLNGLYLLIVGIFTTWLVPNLSRVIFSGRRSKRQVKTFSKYLIDIEKLKESPERKNAKELRTEIIGIFLTGCLMKVNSQH